MFDLVTGLEEICTQFVVVNGGAANNRLTHHWHCRWRALRQYRTKGQSCDSWHDKFRLGLAQIRVNLSGYFVLRAQKLPADLGLSAEDNRTLRQ